MSLRLASSVRFRRVLDEGVVLRLDTGEILGLNGVGARVVEMVADGLTARRAIGRALRQELTLPEGTGEAEVTTDIDRFVDELVELGALLDDGSGEGAP